MRGCTVSAMEEPEPGREMEFVFDTSKVHLFDTATEKVI